MPRPPRGPARRLPVAGTRHSAAAVPAPDRVGGPGAAARPARWARQAGSDRRWPAFGGPDRVLWLRRDAGLPPEPFPGRRSLEATDPPSGSDIGSPAPDRGSRGPLADAADAAVTGSRPVSVPRAPARPRLRVRSAAPGAFSLCPCTRPYRSAVAARRRRGGRSPSRSANAMDPDDDRGTSCPASQSETPFPRADADGARHRTGGLGRQDRNAREDALQEPPPGRGRTPTTTSPRPLPSQAWDRSASPAARAFTPACATPRRSGSCPRPRGGPCTGGGHPGRPSSPRGAAGTEARPHQARPRRGRRPAARRRPGATADRGSVHGADGLCGPPQRQAQRPPMLRADRRRATRRGPRRGAGRRRRAQRERRHRDPPARASHLHADTRAGRVMVEVPAAQTRTDPMPADEARRHSARAGQGATQPIAAPP